MKRFFTLMVLSALLLSLAGVLSSCGRSDDRSDKPLVVTTIFPPYDFARAVGGDCIDLSVLVTVTDSHSFSPTAADMAMIEECDLFIYTGGDGDLWAEDFLETIDVSDKVILNMMELCPLYEGEHDHEHNHDHDHDHDEPVYDEHVWLDPENAMTITSAIRDALISIDPTMADTYESAAEGYLAELRELNEAFCEAVKVAPGKKIVVADQFPFRYLCEAYGLDYASALPGCGSASDLTAIEYENLAAIIRDEKLSVILCTEYSDRSVANTVLRESGQNAEILSLHSCHTLTKWAIGDGATYLSIMRENLNVLIRALN